MSHGHLLIKKPLITEKGTRLSEVGQYLFVVQEGATKNEVKKVVRELYKVDVAKVNIINLPGKVKKFRNLRGRQSGLRKAVVTLKTGQKINITQ